MFKAATQGRPSGQGTGFRPRATLALAFLAYWVSGAAAHGISEESRETMAQGGLLEYIWLGAEHMVTGYDHLLFLFGVIFFLTGFGDVVRFITAFTLGHCITLLGATMAGITANAYLIDAVIALSVIYKGFENLDGFKRTFGIRAPNLLGMVFLFGLIHGFGLSTRLQEITLGHEGLVSRILAFNVGVELGQVAALTAMLAFFAAWRSTKTFERFGKVANVGLVLAGLALFVMQMNGYLHEGEHHDHHAAEAVTEEDHGHGDDDHAHDGHGHDDHDHAPAPESAPPADEKATTDHGHGGHDGHGHDDHDHGDHNHGDHSHGSGEKHSH